jgi:hypothetical protein
MKSRREYLASLTPPLAKSGVGVRGRFSRVAEAELARARASGMQFSDDKGTEVQDSAVTPEDAPYVPVRGPNEPIVRDIESVIGYTEQGWKVESAHCMRCALHVKRCTCRGGIRPSSIVARWDEASEPYVYPIDLPDRA